MGTFLDLLEKQISGGYARSTLKKIPIDRCNTQIFQKKANLVNHK